MIYHMTATEETQSLARDARDVQDACNIGGVANLFQATIKKLYRHPDYAGSAWVARNPITIALLDKLCHLAGIQSFSGDAGVDKSRAHWQVLELIDGETVEFDKGAAP